MLTKDNYLLKVLLVVFCLLQSTAGIEMSGYFEVDNRLELAMILDAQGRIEGCTQSLLRALGWRFEQGEDRIYSAFPMLPLLPLYLERLDAGEPALPLRTIMVVPQNPRHPLLKLRKQDISAQSLLQAMGKLLEEDCANIYLVELTASRNHFYRGRIEVVHVRFEFIQKIKMKYVVDELAVMARGNARTVLKPASHD